jgi:hypothetical protein
VNSDSAFRVLKDWGVSFYDPGAPFVRPKTPLRSLSAVRVVVGSIVIV